MGTHTKSRRMKVFSIATLATVAMAQKGTMMLDEDVECENFGGKFDKIKGMKPVCTVNKGPIAKKWRCNLKCSNKNENVWSVRPIKCKIKNHPESKRFDSNLPTTYKWRPNQIRDAETLCDEKEECGNIRTKYNVTNKLLSWTKTKSASDRPCSSSLAPTGRTRRTTRSSRCTPSPSPRPRALTTTTSPATSVASGPRSRTPLCVACARTSPRATMKMTSTTTRTCTHTTTRQIDQPNYTHAHPIHHYTQT